MNEKLKFNEFNKKNIYVISIIMYIYYNKI